eukprot:TRINITY_DN4435_c1_g1_i2.p1 TRINITY_DN4435_c1_g1~~TRINITY_DN4435_c1_g1_i2.p1  ORF type:complete len:637 (+),score=217.70 TRINITY_DN4435_c1_g1_i2:131-1912(+)
MPEVHLSWASALQALSRHSEATQRFQAAAKQFPKLLRVATVHFNWGLSLHYCQEFQEAIDHFKRAIELQPTHGDAEVAWGNALLKLHRDGDGVAQAVQHYRNALSINPKLTLAKVNLDIAEQRLKKKRQLSFGYSNYGSSVNTHRTVNPITSSSSSSSVLNAMETDPMDDAMMQQHIHTASSNPMTEDQDQNEQHDMMDASTPTKQGDDDDDDDDDDQRLELSPQQQQLQSILMQQQQDDNNSVSSAGSSTLETLANITKAVSESGLTLEDLDSVSSSSSKKSKRSSKSAKGRRKGKKSGKGLKNISKKAAKYLFPQQHTGSNAQQLVSPPPPLFRNNSTERLTLAAVEPNRQGQLFAGVNRRLKVQGSSSSLVSNASSTSSTSSTSSSSSSSSSSGSDDSSVIHMEFPTAPIVNTHTPLFGLFSPRRAMRDWNFKARWCTNDIYRKCTVPAHISFLEFCVYLRKRFRKHIERAQGSRVDAPLRILYDDGPDRIQIEDDEDLTNAFADFLNDLNQQSPTGSGGAGILSPHPNQRPACLKLQISLGQQDLLEELEQQISQDEDEQRKLHKRDREEDHDEEHGLELDCVKRQRTE